jgi:hypothetical protein
LNFPLFPSGMSLLGRRVVKRLSIVISNRIAWY